MKGLKRIIVAALAATVLVAPATAEAHGNHDRLPLSVAKKSHGKRVADVQWLLGGHRPSAYRKSVKTFKWKPNGLYGKRTAKAVRDAKWRLGFPKKAVNGVAGRDFIQILKGERKRPIMYVARASKRLKASKHHSAIQPGTSRWAAQMLSVARRYIGVTEVPWGSNRGYWVSRFQSSTGAYGAPWCVSFVQYVLIHSRYGTIAHRSAGVFYVVGWARNRGMVRSQAKAGRLVAFMDRLGHIGIVERVFPGGFYSIEGNASNAVLRRKHFIGRRPMVFVSLPGVS